MQQKSKNCKILMYINYNVTEDQYKDKWYTSKPYLLLTGILKFSLKANELFSKW